MFIDFKSSQVQSQLEEAQRELGRITGSGQYATALAILIAAQIIANAIRDGVTEK